MIVRTIIRTLCAPGQVNVEEWRVADLSLKSARLLAGDAPPDNHLVNVKE